MHSFCIHSQLLFPPKHPYSAKHFIFFVFEFELVQQAELEAIEALVSRLREEYQAQGRSQKQIESEAD